MNYAGGKAKVERSKSGVPGLDEILNGGFIPKRLYLLDGDPGAGEDHAVIAIPARRREGRREMSLHYAFGN